MITFASHNTLVTLPAIMWLMYIVITYDRYLLATTQVACAGGSLVFSLKTIKEAIQTEYCDSPFQGTDSSSVPSSEL